MLPTRERLELQQMTANPVRGSRAAALERSAPFGPLIKSSTWKLSLPTLWNLVVLKQPCYSCIFLFYFHRAC